MKTKATDWEQMQSRHLIKDLHTERDLELLKLNRKETKPLTFVNKESDPDPLPKKL